MDLPSMILIFAVIMSVTYLFFVCYFGVRLLKMHQLILADAGDTQDLNVRRMFLRKTMIIFMLMLGSMFLELICLSLLVLLFNK